MLPAALSMLFYSFAPPSAAVSKPPATIAPSTTVLSDPLLQKRVTISAKGIALHELLKIWGKESGVLLSADRYTSEQKIQLQLRDRPLSDVLSGIAELLQGEWIVDKEKGYRLRRSPEAIAYAKEWWKRYDQERERMRQAAGEWFVGRMTRYKTDSIQLKQIEETGDISSLNGFHSARFWNDIPPTVKQAVANRYEDRSDMRLPEVPGGSNYTSLLGENEIAFPFTDLPITSQESLNYTLQKSQPNFSGQTINTVIVASGSSGLNSRVVLNSGHQMQVDYLSKVYGETVPQLLLDHSNLAEKIEKRGDKPSKDAAVLLQYQKKTVWQTDNLPKPDREDYRGRLPDVLSHYAQETKEEYIADYYSLPYRPLTQAEWKKKIPDPDKELRSVAANYDISFRRTKGLVLIRHNRWYRNDALEASTDVVTRLEKMTAAPLKAPETFGRSAARIYPSLEIAAQMTNEAPLYQIANSLYYGVSEKSMPAPELQTEMSLFKSRSQPLLQIANSAFMYYPVVRLYALLSHEERIAVLTVGLPISALSPTAYQQLSTIKAVLPTGGRISLDGYVGGGVRAYTKPNGQRGFGHPYQFGTTSLSNAFNLSVSVLPAQ